MLVRGGRDVHRIGLVRKVVDLHHRQNRRGAGEEGVRRPRQGRDVGLSIRWQEPLAAEHSQELHSVAFPRLTLARGFAWFRKETELLLQIEVALLPPAAQGRQVVTPDDCQGQLR